MFLFSLILFFLIVILVGFIIFLVFKKDLWKFLLFNKLKIILIGFRVLLMWYGNIFGCLGNGM